MSLLQIIDASTWPGRCGPLVATWFENVARRHGGFDVEPADLAEPALPLFDEAPRPALRQYAHVHTRAWSMTVNRADAFVFVTPEYDYDPPASLVNALQLHEWAYKPAGFVSYRSVSGGTRAVEVGVLDEMTKWTGALSPLRAATLEKQETA